MVVAVHELSRVSFWREEELIIKLIFLPSVTSVESKWRTTTPFVSFVPFQVHLAKLFPYFQGPVDVLFLAFLCFPQKRIKNGFQRCINHQKILNHKKRFKIISLEIALQK